MYIKSGVYWRLCLTIMVNDHNNHLLITIISITILLITIISIWNAGLNMCQPSMLIIMYGGNMRRLSWIMEKYHQIVYKSVDFMWQDPWNDVTQLWLKRVVVRFHIPRQAFQDPVLRSGKKFMGCLVKIGASILVASWDLMSRFKFLSLDGVIFSVWKEQWNMRRMDSEKRDTDFWVLAFYIHICWRLRIPGGIRHIHFAKPSDMSHLADRMAWSATPVSRTTESNGLAVATHISWAAGRKKGWVGAWFSWGFRKVAIQDRNTSGTLEACSFRPNFV